MLTILCRRLPARSRAIGDLFYKKTGFGSFRVGWFEVLGSQVSVLVSVGFRFEDLELRAWVQR